MASRDGSQVAAPTLAPIRQGLVCQGIQAAFGDVSLELTVPDRCVEFRKPGAKRGQVLVGEFADGVFDFSDGIHGANVSPTVIRCNGLYAPRSGVGQPPGQADAVLLHDGQKLIVLDISKRAIGLILDQEPEVRQRLAEPDVRRQLMDVDRFLDQLVLDREDHGMKSPTLGSLS